jgi:hypothetical protein
MDEAAEDIGSS